MKRMLVAVLGSAALLLAVSSTANADAFLLLQNGLTTLSCNNSVGGRGRGLSGLRVHRRFWVASRSALLVPSVDTSCSMLALTSNSPGNPLLAFATDTKTAVQNVSAGATALIVSFAVNNFALPAGTPLTLSASQAATFVSASAGTSQAFTAWANAANTLATATERPAATPNCVNPAAAPPVNACSTVGAPVLFARAGNFALNGVETINLNQGGIANFQGSIAVTPSANHAVPEPGSLVLLATGLFGLVGGRRFLRRNA